MQPSCVRVHERARAAVVCVRSRACVCSRRVCAFTSVRVQLSCARAHERPCASTSPVRVRRVRAVTSVMDLRSISGRKINKVYLNPYLNQYLCTYLFIINMNNIAMLERE